MTAVVTVEGGHIRAPRGARIRAGLGLVYIWTLAAFTLARAMSFRYIIQQGEGAAARAVVASATCAVLAALVAVIREARVSVDEDGVRWGWSGGVGFRLARRRIATALVYEDAVALKLGRGSTWYLSGRDYTPYRELVAALKRNGMPVVDAGRRAPLRARLQAYGVALDILLVVAILAVTATFLVA